MVVNKLSAAEVETKKKPGRYGDGGGLWLQVARWEGRTKSWVFQYTFNGDVRQLGGSHVAAQRRMIRG